MFVGYNTTWLPWLPITATLTWLPWSFYFVVGIFRSKKWSDTGLFGISILLTFLGGHIQFVYYSYLSVMFFILWLFFSSSRPWKNRFHPLALSLVGFALGVFSSSVQLISTLELAELSIRGAKPIQELMYTAIPWIRLPTLVVPELFGDVNLYRGHGNFVEFTGYISILGLILAVFSWLHPRVKEHSEFLFFLLLAILSLHLAYGGVLNLVVQFLPGYTSFNTLSRFYSQWTFASSFLTAFGFEAVLLAKGWRRRVWLILSILLACVGVFFIPLAKPSLQLIVDWVNMPFSPKLEGILKALYLLFISTISLIIILISPHIKFKIRNLFSVLIIGLITFDLFYFGITYLPTIAKHSAYPLTQSINFLMENREDGRIARYKSGFYGSPLPPNINIVYQLEDIDGYDSFSLDRYSQLLGAVEADLYLNSSSYNQLFGFQNIESLDSPILQVLRVAYLISEEPIIGLPKVGKSNTWIPTYQGKDMIIYKNQKELPLARIIGKYQVRFTDEDQIEAMKTNTFDPNEEVILNSYPPLVIDPNAEGTVEITNRTLNHIDMDIVVQAEEGYHGVLVIGQNNYPGWRAKVDGVPAEILTVDYLLQGVLVSSGHHMVEISFVPSYFLPSLFLSLFSLIGIAGCPLIKGKPAGEL